MKKISWLFVWQVLCLVAAVYLLVVGTWQQWLIAFGVYAVTGSIGASAILHRLLSHRSYQAPQWWHWFGSIVATLGGVGSTITWVAIHRAHHRFVDTEKDPHSPRHKGWLRVQFLIMFNTVNLRLVPDLLRSRFHQYLHNYYFLIHAIYASILYALDPMAVIYAHLVPSFMLFHAGGLINTVGHSIGFQTYPGRDSSVNNPVLGVLVWGEGWHNNHHANPGDWRFGQKWWQIDVAAYIIRLVKQ